MTNAEILPVHAIIDYTWALLKLNTNMKESDYGGKIPVIAASQQPEFTESSKPFIVYAWSEEATPDIQALRTGSVAFAVYGTTIREITKIANIISVAFGKFDETASEVNHWKRNTIFNTIRFASFQVSVFDGPTPETQEGGRQSAVVMVRYKCFPDYEVQIPS